MKDNKLQIIQEHMDINHFGEIKNNKQFSKLLDMMTHLGLKPSVDQSIYLEIAKQVKHLTHFAKDIADIDRTDQQLAQMSNETKLIYHKQAEQILQLIDQQKLSEAQMIQLLDILKDINQSLKEIDRQEKEALNKSKWIKSSFLNGLIGVLGVIVFAIFNIRPRK